MKTEIIKWRELPKDGMPDADLTVLVSTEHHGVDTGWFDGKDWRSCESGGVIGEAVQAWSELPSGISAEEVLELAAYDPNVRWATNTMEITYMQWDYQCKVLIETGGNCKGLDVMRHVVATHAEQLFEQYGADAMLVMTRPSEDGTGEDQLEVYPDDEDFEGWLSDMCVGIRIVKHEEDVLT